MTKKGKRASDGTGKTDSSRRRPASSAATKCKADMLYTSRVVGPPILPPPRSDGKKRIELHLISKRVYEETILRVWINRVRVAVRKRGAMMICQGSTLRNYLEVYLPCAGGLSTVNAIGHPTVWSLALCPDDAKQDPVMYSAESSVVSLAEGPHIASIQEGLDCLGLYQWGLEGERYFRIDGLLSARECATWISHAEENGFERSFHAQTAEIAHRDNGRITLHSPAVAAAVFARVSAFVPAEMDGRLNVELAKTIGLDRTSILEHRSAAGCNANIRIYRYNVGQRFGKHVDESVEDENGQVSYWTVLIYLNGGEEGSAATDGRDTGSGADEALEPLRGGETVFYKGNYGGKIAASFPPTMGACLIHGHGRRCLLHEGAVVTAGAKYVLRTDVMYA